MQEYKYALGNYQAKDIDQERAAALVKTSFGRDLVPRYFETEEISDIILEQDYRGMAVLEEHNGWLYLDKFCVDPKLRSNGLGSEIFSYMLGQADGKGVFWRSRKTNPSVGWYYIHALDFSIRYAPLDPWMVFWMGNVSIGDNGLYAVQKPDTLRPA